MPEHTRFCCWNFNELPRAMTCWRTSWTQCLRACLSSCSTVYFCNRARTVSPSWFAETKNTLVRDCPKRLPVNWKRNGKWCWRWRARVILLSFWPLSVHTRSIKCTGSYMVPWRPATTKSVRLCLLWFMRGSRPFPHPVWLKTSSQGCLTM